MRVRARPPTAGGGRTLRKAPPAPKPPRPPKRQPDLTKVSANFVPRSVAALEMASEVTGDNQTDVINRAVQLYAYISKMVENGSLIFVENPRHRRQRTHRHPLVGACCHSWMSPLPSREEGSSVEARPVTIWPGWLDTSTAGAAVTEPRVHLA
jgi:hypothetical protein